MWWPHQWNFGMPVPKQREAAPSSGLQVQQKPSAEVRRANGEKGKQYSLVKKEGDETKAWNITFWEDGTFNYQHDVVEYNEFDYGRPEMTWDVEAADGDWAPQESGDGFVLTGTAIHSGGCHWDEELELLKPSTVKEFSKTLDAPLLASWQVTLLGDPDGADAIDDMTDASKPSKASASATEVIDVEATAPATAPEAIGVEATAPAPEVIGASASAVDVEPRPSGRVGDPKTSSRTEPVPCGMGSRVHLLDEPAQVGEVVEVKGGGWRSVRLESGDILKKRWTQLHLLSDGVSAE